MSPQAGAEKLQSSGSAPLSCAISSRGTVSAIPPPRTSPSLLCFSVPSSLLSGNTYWTIHSVSRSVVPTLFDPMDCGPPGSSVREIFQARILEWVAISFSIGPYATTIAQLLDLVLPPVYCVIWGVNLCFFMSDGKYPSHLVFMRIK